MLGIFYDNIYEASITLNYIQFAPVDIINETGENPAYLPGVKLPKCIIASSDLDYCCRDANVLLVCM